MPDTKKAREPGTEHLHDLTDYGEAFLREGIKNVLSRAFALASINFNAETEDGGRVVQAWYDALIGTVPCIYWKECSLKALEIMPYHRFTYGQMTQAWHEMIQEGKAPGHLKA